MFVCNFTPNQIADPKILKLAELVDTYLSNFNSSEEDSILIT